MREISSAHKPRRRASLGLVVAGTVLAGTAWSSPAACPPEMIVPDDFALIQDAIDAALPGELILLGNGPFFENIVISKANVTLQPQTGASPIIQGDFSTPTVHVVADNVTIENLNILGGVPAGILLDHVDGVRVIGNVLNTNSNGVQADHAKNCEFRDNLAFDNDIGFFVLNGDTGNFFVDNVATQNVAGFLSFASRDDYYKNEATRNIVGFEMHGSENLLRGNNARENELGFGLGAGLITAGGGSNTLKRNEAKDNLYGAWIYGESQTVVENTFLRGLRGLDTLSSGHDIIGNTATGCAEWGFLLGGSLAPDAEGGTTGGTLLEDNEARECGFGFITAEACADIVGNYATRCHQDGFLTIVGDNLFDSNKASRNEGYGMVDDTTGKGTAGTANTYVGNRCRSNELGGSFPEGLCTD